MKKTTAILVLALAATAAHAQTTSTATQSSASNSVAQGTIEFSQSPADQHLSETVRNVSAPVLGAYAASFSQLNCGQTVQFGGAIAGVSVVGGASHSLQDCKLEVAAAETARQSTIASDPEVKAGLQAAAIAIRCQVDPVIYRAYVAAGLDCKGLKPEGMESRTDEQPANYRVASAR